MKKMMLMMAFMLVAGLSQAAFVQWSTGTLQTPGAGGVFGANVGSTTGIYLATVSFFADDGGVAGAAIGGVTVNTDNTTSALSVLNGTTGGFSFVANSTYWTQVFVTSSVGVGYTMTSTLASFTVPGTANANLNYLTGVGFTTAGSKMPTSWTPVPEPTSMALLALGAAALGLRRKFRK